MKGVELFLVPTSGKGFVDVISDLLHLRLFHVSRRDGSASETHTTRHKRRLRIKRNRIAVGIDTRFIQEFLGLFTRDPFRTEIHHEEMVVRPTTHDAVAFFLQS